MFFMAHFLFYTNFIVHMLGGRKRRPPSKFNLPENYAVKARVLVVPHSMNNFDGGDRSAASIKGKGSW
jgi:hypothetical protein